MKILYIFPHPDDESFGPAPAISWQRRNNDEVYLLTLTKGEATKQRFKLNKSKQEMGEIRYQEMQEVAKVLDLNDLTVLDFPDNELKEIDPIELEEAIEKHIHAIEPDIVVTYAVHGISGFHDHLVSHAIVKRVYCSLKRKLLGYPKRLAFFTLKDVPTKEGSFDLNTSTEEEIDCIIETEQEDMKKFNQALDCYKTYQEVIEKSNVREDVSNEISFEFFQENYSPPLNDLTEDL
jgi:LmbE family N-acetylglucosaminyl deacetylase